MQMREAQERGKLPNQIRSEVNLTGRFHDGDKIVLKGGWVNAVSKRLMASALWAGNRGSPSEGAQQQRNGVSRSKSNGIWRGVGGQQGVVGGEVMWAGSR